MSTIEPRGAEMAFVVSTGLEKPDPEMRKFIRSHVMRGKNLGKSLRPKTKEPQGARKSSENIPDHSRDQLDSSATTSHLAITRKVGSDLATVRFADTVEPHAVQTVLQFSSIAKRTLFPLESCILFERREENWIEPLAYDAAYLHALIFSTHDYFNALIRGKPCATGKSTLPHFLRTLELLRERLSHSDDNERLSTTTASVVLTLAAHAHFVGDTEFAKHHLRGLHQILRLKGGVVAFRDNAKLLIEVLRCDIGIALDTGSKPIFFDESSCQNAPPRYPDQYLLASKEHAMKPNVLHNSDILFDGIDPSLAAAFAALVGFCRLMNFAVESELRTTTETYLDTMTSVIYRLTYMSFSPGSADEAVRLGLLAFSTSIFLQWRQLGRPYSHLTHSYRDALSRVKHSQLHSRLMVWLFMAGAVSVFESADIEWLKPWLVANVDFFGVHSWSTLRRILGEVMWIDLIHNQSGEAVFNRIIL